MQQPPQGGGTTPGSPGMAKRAPSNSTPSPVGTKMRPSDRRPTLAGKVEQDRVIPPFWGPTIFDKSQPQQQPATDQNATSSTPKTNVGGGSQRTQNSVQGGVKPQPTTKPSPTLQQRGTSHTKPGPSQSPQQPHQPSTTTQPPQPQPSQQETKPSSEQTEPQPQTTFTPKRRESTPMAPERQQQGLLGGYRSRSGSAALTVDSSTVSEQDAASSSPQTRRRQTKSSRLTQYLHRAEVLYTYRSDKEHELSIRKGQVILVHERDVSGWWTGEVDGQYGLFPGSYVRVLGNKQPPMITRINSNLRAPPSTPSEEPEKVIEKSETTPVLKKEGEGGTILYRTAQALYNYTAKGSDEIDLAQDDVLSVYEVDETGWYLGENQRTKKVGLFPGEFVQFSTSSLPVAVKVPEVVVAQRVPIERVAVRPKELKSRAKVLSDYDALEEGEISLVAGEMMVVFDVDAENGWCTGVSEKDKDRYGLFPCDKIEILGPIVEEPQADDEDEEGDFEDGEDDEDDEDEEERKRKFKGQDMIIEQTDFYVHLDVDEEEDSGSDSEDERERMEKRRKEWEEQDKFFKDNQSLFDKRREELAKARKDSDVDKTLHKMTIKNTGFSVSLAIDDDEDGNDVYGGGGGGKGKKEDDEEAMMERRRQELRKQRDEEEKTKTMDDDGDSGAMFSATMSLDDEENSSDEERNKPKKSTSTSKTGKEDEGKKEEFINFIYAKNDKKEKEIKEQEELKEKKTALKADYAKKKIEDRYAAAAAASGGADSASASSSAKAEKDKKAGIFGSVKWRNKGQKKVKKPKAKKPPKAPKSLSSEERASVLLHYKVTNQDEDNEEGGDEKSSTNENQTKQKLKPSEKKERRMTKGRPPRPPGMEGDGGWLAVKRTPGNAHQQPKMGTRSDK